MFHRYKTPKYYLSLSADDLAMVKGILLWWRNKLIREGKPTEDVDELTLKLMRTNKYDVGQMVNARNNPRCKIHSWSSRKRSRGFLYEKTV